MTGRPGRSREFGTPRGLVDFVDAVLVGFLPSLKFSRSHLKIFSPGKLDIPDLETTSFRGRAVSFRFLHTLKTNEYPPENGLETLENPLISRKKNGPFSGDIPSFSEGVVFVGFLGGGFKHVFIFTRIPGEIIQFDYFSKGLKPPTLDFRKTFKKKTKKNA